MSTSACDLHKLLGACSAATKWLAGFLRNSSGGLILVSHDQELLQGICNVIVEVRGRTLHHFTGDYNNYLEVRELRNQQTATTALRQEKKIANLEKFVSRFGAKASKASQAQSRAKQLEKLKSNVVVGPAVFSSEGPGDARKVKALTTPVIFFMIELPWTLPAQKMLHVLVSTCWRR